MDVLLGIPITLPSVEGQPSLEPIPGSAAATPLDQTRRNSPEQSAEEVTKAVGGAASDGFGASYAAAVPVVAGAYGVNAEAGPSRPSRSRASSIGQQYSQPGSYFPIAVAQSAYTEAPSPQSVYRSSPPTPSGLYPPATLGGPGTPQYDRDRPRPEPLAIPPGTPDEPLFSAYPDTTGVRQFAPLQMPLRTALHLADHATRRASPRQYDTSDPQSVISSGSSSPSSRPRGRKRAATLSSAPPFVAPTFTLPDAPQGIPPSPRSPPHRSIRNSLHLPSILRRRRASLGSRPHGRHFNADDTTDSDGHWPKMAQEEAHRMHLDPAAPFTYNDNDGASHALEQVSAYTKVMPLASPRPVPSRRSSLIGAAPDPAYQGILTDAAPTPPPRRSSLSFGPDQIIAIGSIPISPKGNTSVLSASVTSTEGSSAEFFSPTLSQQHPLSSATTSLSRSAKSSKDKEKEEDETEIKQVSASLAALRLQRSLEWEARQARRRRRLDKRKMILLELIDTEVAYAEDLRLLVQVYLPQLAALPSITTKIASVIGRNAGDLLIIHSAISVEMVEILRQEQLGFRCVADDELEGKVERVSRRVASLLVENATGLSAYNAFCAGSIAAAGMVRNLSLRTDYDAFEKRCQIICASFSAARLQDLLDDSETAATISNKSRLHFKDYLIMPIQRVCRYPLLLSSLLGSTDTPSSPVERPDNMFEPVPSDEYDVGVDVERALGAMRGVAEEADEARRRTEAELRSATVTGRIEPHHSVTPSFLKSMGTCRLIGSLDVLYHHPTLSPLVPPVKVKYLAAFLYRGYLVLAKVKKTKTYEVKHFLPLEVFELIDITEGFLPHSIRLTLRDHNFDLAASCSAEKEVWTAALVAARDESTVPPFELPTSISPFATRPRRVSAVGLQPPTIDTAISLSPVFDPATKRHTLAAYPDFAPMELPQPVTEAADVTTSPVAITDESVTPHSSIALSSHGLSSMSANGQVTATSTLLLRRATPAQRLIVDRGLLDVFSDSCAQARSKAQLHHALFLPDAPARGHELRDRLSMRDSTMLRRRKSFLDSRSRTQSMDIAFSGEVRGSIMDRPKSLVGTKRTSMGGHARGHTEPTMSTSAVTCPVRKRSRDASDDAGTPDIDADNADDSATAGGTSDLGTLRGREHGTFTRTTSVASVSPGPSNRPLARRSLSLFKPNFDVFSTASRPAVPTMVPMPPTSYATQKSVRRTASAMNMSQRARQNANKAKSTPASPNLRAQRDKESPHKVQRASSDPDRLEHADTSKPPPVDPVQSPDMVPDMSVSTPDVGDPQTVYSRGQGLTNTPDRNRNSITGSIRRGVSMLKSRGNSSVNLVEMGSNSTVSVVGLGLNTGSIPNSALTSASALASSASGSGSGSDGTPTTASSGSAESGKVDDVLTPPAFIKELDPKEGAPVKRSNSSLFLSHFTGSTSKAEIKAKAEEDDEKEDRVDTTPRRRRSVKLLQTLRGFTPM